MCRKWRLGGSITVGDGTQTGKKSGVKELGRDAPREEIELKGDGIQKEKVETSGWKSKETKMDGGRTRGENGWVEMRVGI